MLRIGLLGASRIAPKAVIAPTSRRTDVRITAIAATEKRRAQGYADQYGIPAVADSYEALARRDDVDLIYCALPPAKHLAQCLLALSAGKALLVEKPFAMNAQETRLIVKAADQAGRPAIEAFHYRFHSQFARALDLLNEGAIGPVREVRGLFTAPIRQAPDELRWRRELGGGGVMDLGCYVVHALRTLLQKEPEVHHVDAELRDGVDATMIAQIKFPQSISGSLHCSMVGPRRDEIVLEGEAGELTLEAFVSPQNGGRLKLRTASGLWVQEASGPSSYDAQLEHVVRVITGEVRAVTGGVDAIANMVVLDKLRRDAGMSVDSMS